MCVCEWVYSKLKLGITLDIVVTVEWLTIQTIDDVV